MKKYSKLFFLIAFTMFICSCGLYGSSNSDDGYISYDGVYNIKKIKYDGYDYTPCLFSGAEQTLYLADKGLGDIGVYNVSVLIYHWCIWSDLPITSGIRTNLNPRGLTYYTVNGRLTIKSHSDSTLIEAVPSKSKNSSDADFPQDMVDTDYYHLD